MFSEEHVEQLRKEDQERYLKAIQKRGYSLAEARWLMGLDLEITEYTFKRYEIKLHETREAMHFRERLAVMLADDYM